VGDISFGVHKGVESVRYGSIQENGVNKEYPGFILRDYLQN